MASRHTCVKTQRRFFFSHLFSTLQKLDRHILRHLHKKQCDESNQKGPSLSREIEEVHLWSVGEHSF